METDLILPGGISKGQPVAALYSSFSISVTSGMAVSFSDCFSAVKANNGTLTCLKTGKYKIFAAMRCRFCYFYVYVNNVQKLVLSGTNMNAPDTGIVEDELEIELLEGDVVKASSTKWNSDDRYSICYANIFKA